MTQDRTADPRNAAALCRESVAAADVYVLIAGFRYGTAVPGDPRRRSYTEMEFDEAGRLDLPRLVFLLEGDEQSKPGRNERQARFRDRVRASRATATFTSPETLETAVLTALVRLEELDWKPGEGTTRLPADVTAHDTTPHRASSAHRQDDRQQVGQPDRGRRRRPLIACGAAMLASITVAALIVSCNTTTNPCAPVAGEQVRQADGTLRFGSIFPQTGPLSAQGEQLRAAADLAVRDVRAAGPLPGISGGVTLAPQDQMDEGDPTTATSCEAVGRLIAGGVDVITGPSASASAIQMAPRFTSAGGVVVSPGSTAPELTGLDDGGRFFRTAPSDLLQGRIMGDIVALDGGEKVAVVARGDAYGRGVSSEVVKELRGLGGQDIRAVEYEPASKPEDTDFREIVDDIRGRATDAVVVVGFSEIGWLLNDLAEIGITPRETNIYATDGFLRDTFPKNPVIGGPELVAGLRGTRPLLDRRFRSTLSASAGRSLSDYSLAPQAYDSVVITALASLAARSDDPRVFGPEINNTTRAGTKCTSYAACRSLLLTNPDTDIDYDGVSGPLDFTGDGDPCQGYYSVERYDSAGQLQEYRRAFGNYLCTGPLPLPR